MEGNKVCEKERIESGGDWPSNERGRRRKDLTGKRDVDTSRVPEFERLLTFTTIVPLIKANEGNGIKLLDDEDDGLLR